MSLRIRLRLPDGRVYENAGGVIVEIEDEKPGTEQRRLGSIVSEHREYCDRLFGRRTA